MDAKTETLVAGLHKRLGVRRHDLGTEIVKTALGDVWRITRADAESIVLAKVIYRLESVFRTIPDPHARAVAPAIYNINPDLEMHMLDLGARQDLLRTRHPGEEGYAPRSIARIITTLVNALMRSLIEPAGIHPTSHRKALRPPMPDVPEDVLLATVQREYEFVDRVAGVIGPAAFDRMVRLSFTARIDDAAAAFLTLPAIVPMSHSSELIIARTRDQGDWLCVFSTEDALQAHLAATPGQPWSGRWARRMGAELVRTVADRWTSVGILINPPATPSPDTVTALRITPESVAELARHF
jgi:hypothetical protein